MIKALPKTPLLEMDNMSVELPFGTRTADIVSGITLTLNRGERLGVVGESGSGKSITALSVMQLLPQDIASHPAGEILFNGQNMLTLPEAALRGIRGSQIAMIFQEPMTSLNPVLSIGEQITEALQLHNPTMSDAEAVERARTLLAHFDSPSTRQRS